MNAELFRIIYFFKCQLRSSSRPQNFILFFEIEDRVGLVYVCFYFELSQVMCVEDEDLAIYFLTGGLSQYRVRLG